MNTTSTAATMYRVLRLAGRLARVEGKTSYTMSSLAWGQCVTTAREALGVSEAEYAQAREAATEEARGAVR